MDSNFGLLLIVTGLVLWSMLGFYVYKHNGTFIDKLRGGPGVWLILIGMKIVKEPKKSK